VGQPVVHFEVTGKDQGKLVGYYSDLFGWQIDTNNPANYGIVQRESNTNADGIGIGGGIGAAPEGSGGGGVTFYVEVPSVEEALARAEALGGQRLWGPDSVPGGGIVLGQLKDPEGNLIGLVQS
jgi:uncharacterized protein